MATLDIKYLCNPTDGTPGPAFDAFEVDAMNAASKGDKRGYSVADTWLGEASLLVERLMRKL